MNRTLAILTTGSRLYDTFLDNSDSNLLSITCSTSIFDEISGRTVKNGTYNYELVEFIKELVKGDLMCHQALWTDTTYLKHTSPGFHLLKQAKSYFITKKALKYWYVTANFLFERSKRLASLNLKDKTLLDYMNYMHISSNHYPVRTLDTCIVSGGLSYNGVRSSLSTNNIAAYKSGLHPDNFVIYESYYNPKCVYTTGLFDKDGFLDEREPLKTVPSGLSFRGVAHFNRRQFNAYIRMRTNLASMAIARGYEAKHMYHAFRTISTLIQYIKYNEVPTKSSSPTFLRDIRRHNYDVIDLEQRFKEHLDEAERLLNEYNGEDTPDIPFIDDIVKKVRETVGRPVLEHA